MVRIVDVAGERECGGGPRSRQLNCEEERQIDRSGRERLQFATYPPSPVSGPVRCCDVTDLCQAFSQRPVRGRGQYMAGLPEADKLLEVARHELAAAVGDDTRPGLGISLAAPLQDDLRVRFLHGGADIPGDNVTRAAIQHTA